MTNKEIIKSWFSGIDAKNFDDVRSLMHADHRFTNPMTPEPVGAEQHLGMMQMMTGAFTGQHHIHQMVQEGDMVAAYGEWKGTHTGEFNGVAPTGRPVRFSWMDMFSLRDGKVAQEYFEMNPMSIMAQITDNNK